MKKIGLFILALMLVIPISMSMATPPTNPGPGYYYHPVTEEIKYFPMGHNLQPNNSRDWKPCDGVICSFTDGILLQKASAVAVAAPLVIKGNEAYGNASDGGWSVGAGGFIEVQSYAQGTKLADAMALANGEACGFGWAFGIETRHFGFGTSGAFTTIDLSGIGTGLGIDNFSFYNNPDYAFVNINYEGEVHQRNGILVDNGRGTYAGGYSETGAIFGGGSFNESYGRIWFLDAGIPALAIQGDHAGAFAGGYTLVNYIDTCNLASANAKTVGFSGYNADYGMVTGSGDVQFQAVVDRGSFGLAAGIAEFNYGGYGSFGMGMAQTGGFTSIQNTPGSSSVTSYSHSSATAGVLGGGMAPGLVR